MSTRDGSPGEAPPAPSLGECLAADVSAVRRYRQGQLLPFVFPNLFAVAVYRLAHWIGRRGLAAAAHGLCLIGTVLTGAEISWRASIGPGLFLEHPVGVVLPDVLVAGRDLRLGAGVLVGTMFGNRQSGSETSSSPGAPKIGDCVEIHARASVLGAIEIGDGAVIGAHALVLKDVPAGAVARGVPARNYLDGVELAGD